MTSFLVAVSLTLGACCTSVAYVPVREERFRSEVCGCDRLRLPLSDDDRKRLVRFLRAGGDTDRIGSEVVVPDAEDRYGGLLALLADRERLTLPELLEGTFYSTWFGDVRIRQVIDAREESPPIMDPVAATDGKYWWIFYLEGKKAQHLLVVKALPTRAPE
jgi:hypothetical protein